MADLGAWKPLLTEARYYDAFAACGATPEEEEFGTRAFGFCAPEKVRVVIVGQDPYPNSAAACGLAFSCAGGSLQPSLRNIWAALHSTGAAPPRADRPPILDLRGWAVQGVLLINAVPVLRFAETDRDRWHTCTRRLLAALDRLCAPKFMLWGKAAQGMAPPAGDRVLAWCHPSPLANIRNGGAFRRCPHFVQTPEIVWDLGAPIWAGIDGACAGNGRADARASYGVAFAGGPLAGRTLAGLVAPETYAEGKPAGRPQPPTNNRGEFLACIRALEACLDAYVYGPIEIVIDSKLVLQTLEEWLPTRQAAGTTHKLQNLDLVLYCAKLLASLRQRTEVRFTHVHSHRPRPSGDDKRELFLWALNNRADRLAGGALVAAP